MFLRTRKLTRIRRLPLPEGIFKTNRRHQYSEHQIFGWLLLTYISRVSFLWDIGKQYSPRCDAAEHNVPSEAIQMLLKHFIENRKKIKITPNAPENDSELLIMKSIRHIHVRTRMGKYRDQPWFSVFKHSMDHEEGV